MFLELSFDSRAGDKEVSTSKAARSWRYDGEDQQEMSLDELISDFRQSARSRRSKLNERSEASSQQMASPPKHSKAKESGKKKQGFADRARIAQRGAPKRNPSRVAHNHNRDDESSDDDGAVMPMPRLEQVLRNKLSFLPRRRVPPVAASTRSKPASKQSRRPPPPSPALSSPSLSPASLSPVTCSSVASSPLSIPKAALTPDEDSIDVLIGKDIRELNNLIAASNQGTQSRKKSISAANSPSTDDVAQVLRQRTRFGADRATSLRPRLQLQMPRGAITSMPESPPPPPPPDEDENLEEDEEDSFAEEIRKLRESRRQNSIPVKASEKEVPKDENESKSSDICATAALKVRNASNAINDLLLEALKPFEDRQREEEKAQALEKENAGGDSAIRKAAQAELQTATQTIVSQLDLTFADMAERRKADLKAEADAAAAAKDAEKKEKEAAEEKKKAGEKETKQREMEILRMLPMQGKLLTCSADIDAVLMQMETEDASAPVEAADSAFAMEAEIKALRSRTQRKIEAIEAQMAAKAQTDRVDGLSWRAADWVRDNFEIRVDSEGKGDDQHVETTADSGVASTTEEEESLQDILQQQVLEKLDLTMLKLKHVLAIDAKESAERQEQQKREEDERAKQVAQQQLEDERKHQELEDAENARRRVMGLTSLDQVEGWVEEGRRLHDELGHNRTLNRLMESLENQMNAHSSGSSSLFAGTVHPNQEEALLHFDYLESAMAPQKDFEEKGVYDRRDHQCGERYHGSESRQGQPCRQWTQTSRSLSTVPQRVKMRGDFSDSEEECSSANSGSSSDEDRYSVVVSKQDARRKNRLPLPSPPSKAQKSQPIRERGHDEYQVHHSSKYSGSENRDEKVQPSQSRTKNSRRRGADRHQFDVTRTIQALQADRRQKAAWIQSHRKMLPPRSPAYNSDFYSDTRRW